MRISQTTTLAAVPLNLQFCHHTYFLSLKKSVILSPHKYPFLQTGKLQKPISPLYSKSVISASSMANSTTTTTTAKPYSVLFVCLGNICRSPAAEGVFTDLVKNKGLDSKFIIDSAGTIGYHEGNQADPRMRASAKRRGIDITSISRPVKPADFRDFDLILVMDKQNKDDILESYEGWRFKETLPPDAHKKVKLMCSYCKGQKATEVPDPYYGGAKGFEKVLDILEDACASLLDSILAENTHMLG